MKQFVDAYRDIQSKTLQVNVLRKSIRTVKMRLNAKMRSDSVLSTDSATVAVRPVSVPTASSQAANALLVPPTPSPLALESSNASASAFELPVGGTSNGTGGSAADITGVNGVGGEDGESGNMGDAKKTMQKSRSAASGVSGGVSESAASKSTTEKHLKQRPPTNVISAPTTPTGPKASHLQVKEASPLTPKWASSSIVRSAAEDLGVHWLTIKHAVYIKRILEVRILHFAELLIIEIGTGSRSSLPMSYVLYKNYVISSFNTV